MKRIFLVILLLFLGIVIHPFVSLGLAVIISFVWYPRYYEFLLLGIVLDSAYQSTVIFQGINLPVYSIISLVLFALVYTMSKRMNMYA